GSWWGESFRCSSKGRPKRPSCCGKPVFQPRPPKLTGSAISMTSVKQLPAPVSSGHSMSPRRTITILSVNWWINRKRRIRLLRSLPIPSRSSKPPKTSLVFSALSTNLRIQGGPDSFYRDGRQLIAHDQRPLHPFQYGAVGRIHQVNVRKTPSTVGAAFRAHIRHCVVFRKH